MSVQTALQPTDKQVAFLNSLIASRDNTKISPAGMKAINDLAQGDADRSDVSKAIDELKALPYKPAAPAASSEPLTAGIYRAPNGDVIKVKAARGTGNLYAQVMVSASGGARINLNDEIVPKFDFVYTPGLIRHITPDMKLTLDDAKAFFTKTGRCMNCKKELKVASSIAKGLGPTCAKMFS